jgi:hypothetical protein
MQSHQGACTPDESVHAVDQVEISDRNQHTTKMQIQTTFKNQPNNHPHLTIPNHVLAH